jgi:uncharacterized protein YbcV (DUF1398 family)
MVIKDMVFKKMADSVRPDVKRRVVLHGIQIQEGITYHIYKNSIGQIVLDPQVTIPASEIWLFHNPQALEWTTGAQQAFEQIKNDASRKRHYKAVKKTIQFLAMNPRHNSLQTHEFTSLKGPDGEKVFEAYAQQRTPAAYRVFWYYGPSKGAITIVAVTPHP